ncbi:MAG: type II secretion system protein GspC [Endozoicomonas sp.]
MLSGLLKQKHLAVLSKTSTLLALVLLCGAIAQLILQLLDFFAPPMPTSDKAASAYSASAKKAPAYDLASIQSANLFGSETLDTETAAVLEESSLDIQVNGVLLSEDSEKSMAFLRLNGEDGVYQKGDAVNNDSNILLESVRDSQVVIRYRGQLQAVAYERREVSVSGLKTTSSSPRKVERRSSGAGLKEVRKSLKSNPSLISQYVTAIPHRQNGQMVGFRVQPGKDSSLFGQLGLKPDDVLLSINDLSLLAGENLPKLSSILTSAKSIDLEIERDGEVIHKTITF